MGATLTMKDFRKHLTGKPISVVNLNADKRMSGVGVARADLNGDGVISKNSELNALFRRIDKFDKNGRPSSMLVRDRTGRASRVANMVQAVGEIAGVNILQQMAQNDILMVGLNKQNKHEAAALRKKGNAVVFIGDGEDDTIKIDGTKYDLTVRAELEAYVDLLDLPEAQEKKVVAAIATGGHDIKDELARIAWVWADAEKGRVIPRRLVISGHSIGDVFWGTKNGDLERSTVANLAKAMPRAARQVEDLHLAACYCGGEDAVKAWLKIFPSLKTVWAYAGSAPGTKVGAIPHLRLWDKATRGDKDTIDRKIVGNTRKGGNVAVWTRRDGYIDDSPAVPIATLRSRITAAEPTFQAYFKGDKTVHNTQTGELRDFYNDIQALLRHPDLPAADRPAAEKKRDVTIRLIYFDKTIKKHFAKERSAVILAGYKSVGLSPVDYAKVSRKDALDAIRKFTDAMKGGGGADATTLRPHLESGLRDLQQSHIPATWIG